MWFNYPYDTNLKWRISKGYTYAETNSADTEIIIIACMVYIRIIKAIKYSSLADIKLMCKTTVLF